MKNFLLITGLCAGMGFGLALTAGLPGRAAAQDRAPAAVPATTPATPAAAPEAAPGDSGAPALPGPGVMSEDDISAYIQAVQGDTGLRLSSPAFADGGTIPVRFTCAGEGISPALQWTGAPEGVKSYVLIVTDPDAEGTFLHWLAYDIPGNMTKLPEKAAGKAFAQGVNTKGTPVYTGPCPPEKAAAHRYYFRLYALDAPTGLAPGATLEAVEAVLAAHTLDQAVLMGRFAR